MPSVASRGRWIVSFVALAWMSSALSALSPAEEPAVAPEPLGVVSDFPDWVTAVAFSPDGTTLAAGTYDEVRLIDPATQVVKGTLKTRNGYARALAFSADGTRLAVGDYQSVSTWDVTSGRRLRKFAGHTGYVTAVALASAELVSGSEDGTVRVWNVASGESVRTIPVGAPVQDIALSPAGDRIATAAGDPTRPNRAGTILLWDIRMGKKVVELVGHERAALAVAFDATGTRLASAGQDEKVNLHDAATGKALGYYAGHSRSVNDVAFLADGDILASVSGGNAGGLCELRLWRTDGSELAAVEPHEQRIGALAVSPGGRTLAVGSQDKTMSLWNVGKVIDTISGGGGREPVEAPRP